MARSLLLVLLLLMPLAHAAAGNPAGNPDLVDFETVSPSEEGLIRIEVSGVAVNDFLARFVGDTLFVPYISFCDFLRIRSEVSPDFTTLLAVLGGTDTIEISRLTNSAHTPTGEIPIPGNAFRVVQGQVYVEQSAIARVLGITVYYDAVNLKLRIAPDERIPLVQWQQAQGKYGALGMASGPASATEREIEIHRQLFSGLSINWTLANMFNPGLSRSSVGLFSLGQQLLFGTLQVDAVASLRGGTEERSDIHIGAASWMYQAPASPVLTSIRLGTFQIDQRKVQGIELTNAPVTPRTGYGTYLLTGQTQPGWTVELYDANRLVDVTRADSTGRYSFRIPMNYGTVDRITRAVGPYGETELREFRLQLDQGMIPAGDVDYSVAVGADSLVIGTSGLGRASLKVGVMDHLTLGAAANYRAQELRRWQRDSIFPSAFAAIWLGGSSTLNAAYEFGSNLIGGSFYTLMPNSTMFQLGLDSLSLERRTYAVYTGANLPVGPVSLGGGARYQHYEETDAWTVEPQISGHLLDVGFIGSTKFYWAGMNGSGDATLPNPLYPTGKGIISSLQLTASPIGGLFITGQGQYDHVAQKFLGINLSTYFRLSRYIGVNLGYNVPSVEYWDRGLLQAQFSFDLHPFRASFLTTYTQGRTSIASLAQGSALISPRGLTLFSETAVGQSAVLIEAFHDRNQNSVRDPDEESMEPPVAWLDIGGTEMRSDDGIFRSLPANRQCRLILDRWSYGAEELYPSRSVFDIYTLPSGVQVVDVPVAPGIDLTGTCMVEDADGRKDTPAFVNGLRVTLVSERRDASYEGEVFSDGTVFIPGVSTGEYRMVFEDGQLASRRLCLTETELRVTVRQDDDHLPTVLFKRCTK